MISSRNKTVAFILGLGLSIFSWIILFTNVILKITTLSQLGIFNIDVVGFFFTTLLLSGYTFVILFKISNVSYFPIILILFHISTMGGSTLAIFFVIIDLIILILMNTSAKKIHTSSDRKYYRSDQKVNPSHQVKSEDVFEAEYYTKED